MKQSIRHLLFSFLLGGAVVFVALHYFVKPLNPPEIQPIIATNNQSSSVLSSNTQVCFSPRGNCTDLIVKALNGAKSSVLVQAYAFTSDPIAEALVSAHNRQVDVQVILDKSQSSGRGGDLQMLSSAGIPVEIDSAHAIAHNKVMVIDGETVITGSFNFTAAAEKSNAENLLIIQEKGLAQTYVDNWKKHRNHSE